MIRIVGLGGGIGASRIWRELITHCDPAGVTLGVNVAEDLWIHGLRVCPDIDTTLYTLSGRHDSDRGWGRRDETWEAMAVLRELGEMPWFNLGDRDLGLHLWRTTALRKGHTLSQLTERARQAFGVPCQVLPVTNNEVTTRIDTPRAANLHYQEYLVRDRAEAPVTGLHLEGASSARPVIELVEAIAAADVVIWAPSNPVASLGLFTAIEEIASVLREKRSQAIAITSVVTHRPIASDGERTRARSRAALLAHLNLPPNATGVARLLTPFCSRFVLDTVDEAERSDIEAMGLEVRLADTLVHLGADGAALVREVLRA